MKRIFAFALLAFLGVVMASSRGSANQPTFNGSVNGGVIYADGATGGNTSAGYHGGNSQASLLIQSHSPVNVGTNYIANYIVLDALNAIPNPIPTGPNAGNIAICLNLTRNNEATGLFSVDCAGDFQSSGGATISGAIFADVPPAVCPGPFCFIVGGNNANGVHVGYPYCPGTYLPCPGLIQSLTPINTTPMLEFDAFSQTTTGTNLCDEFTRNNGTALLMQIDCFGNTTALGTMSGDQQNQCSASSGWPCETNVNCYLTGTSTCSASAATAVPANSVCVLTSNSTSDTTTGVESWKAGLSGTTLTGKVTVTGNESTFAYANVVCE